MYMIQLECTDIDYYKSVLHNKERIIKVLENLSDSTIPFCYIKKFREEICNLGLSLLEETNKDVLTEILALYLEKYQAEVLERIHNLTIQDIKIVRCLSVGEIGLEMRETPILKIFIKDMNVREIMRAEFFKDMVKKNYGNVGELARSIASFLPKQFLEIGTDKIIEILLNSKESILQKTNHIILENGLSFQIKDYTIRKSLSSSYIKKYKEGMTTELEQKISNEISKLFRSIKIEGKSM